MLFNICLIMTIVLFSVGFTPNSLSTGLQKNTHTHTHTSMSPMVSCRPADPDCPGLQPTPPVDSWHLTNTTIHLVFMLRGLFTQLSLCVQPERTR